MTARERGREGRKEGGQGEEEKKRMQGDEEWEGRRGTSAECWEVAGKLSVNGSLGEQLKDNLYFINATKFHYCSHTRDGDLDGGG